MKLIICLIVCAAALIVSQSNAIADETRAPVLGGYTTCEKWIDDRKNGGEAADEDAAWLFGFFSGYNAFDLRPKTPFFNYDESNLVDVISRYCQKSPQHLVVEEAIQFLNSLHKSPPK